jgi:hypothetical protein
MNLERFFVKTIILLINSVKWADENIRVISPTRRQNTTRYHRVSSYVELEVLKLIGASLFDSSRFSYDNTVNISISTKLFIFVHFTVTHRYTVH